MQGPGRYRMSGRRLALAAAAAAPPGLAPALLAGCVREVTDAVETDGRPVPALGRSPKAVQAALGPGVRAERRSPRGNGVISVGSVYVGEERGFRRHDGEWRLFFDKEGRLIGIEARALPALPPAGSMPAIGG